MTKAEKLRASLGDIDSLTDDEILSRARVASGEEPEVFTSPTNGSSRDYHFHFDVGSIFNEDIIEPGHLRHIAFQVTQNCTLSKIIVEGCGTSAREIKSYAVATV